MVDLNKIHEEARDVADKAAPSYQPVGTPEHKAWLATYDKEFSRLLRGESC